MKDEDRFHVPGLGKHIQKRDLLYSTACLQKGGDISAGVYHIARNQAMVVRVGRLRIFVAIFLAPQ
ncbi:MAG: hypothetical protein PHS63_05005, partial [Desulfoplanes sp.]|nr:hypothetical protein [Desulfoplanes sp.]